MIEDQTGAVVRLSAIGNIDTGGTGPLAARKLYIVHFLHRRRGDLDQLFHPGHGVAHGGDGFARVEQIVQPGLVNPRVK